jgi:hypothetical protein
MGLNKLEEGKRTKKIKKLIIDSLLLRNRITPSKIEIIDKIKKGAPSIYINI